MSKAKTVAELVQLVKDDPSAAVWGEAQMLAHREGEGFGKRETVGLIIQVGDLVERTDVHGNVSQVVESRLLWQLMDNVAPQGSGQFEVSSDALQEVFSVMESRNLMPQQVAMWHSHHGEQQGPSTVDIEAFPIWLCNVAFIYHVPTLTTVAYGAGG